MKNLLLVFGLFIALLMSCQNKPAETDETTTKNEEVIGQHSEDHSGEAKTVQLNNGQKWPANDSCRS